ncbi:MAG: oxygenase MpaB family protein [Myxococcota bacterium]
MTVERDQFESRLAWVRAQVSEPEAGIYAPDSVSWRLNREIIVFVGAGRAALLQTAHPFVAHAIDQHSHTRTDPLGRFKRTFDNVYAMIFGPYEAAERSARRVRAIHERMVGSVAEDVGRQRKGDRYEANDEDALLWVYATLVETSVLVYEQCVRPLSDEDKETYYRESWRFAALFGVSPAVLPPTWADFLAYNQRMWQSDCLAVGEPAIEMRRFLLSSPQWIRRPLFRWLEIVTAGLMPPGLREAYELPYGATEQRIHRASMATLRAVVPRLPSRLRVHPAYVEARRRVQGRPGRDRFGRGLERLGMFLIDRGGDGPGSS